MPLQARKVEIALDLTAPRFDGAPIAKTRFARRKSLGCQLETVTKLASPGQSTAERLAAS